MLKTSTINVFVNHEEPIEIPPYFVIIFCCLYNHSPKRTLYLSWFFLFNFKQNRRKKGKQMCFFDIHCICIAKIMVADLCHFVLLCFRGEKAPRETPPHGDFFVFSCFRMATFRPATRKFDTFHASPFRLLFVVSLPGGAKGRHAKTRLNHQAKTRKPATRKPAKWWNITMRKRERSPRENSPNGDFFVFSHGALSPRHTKVRDIPCVAFSATFCRIFAWRGEKSPCEN